MNEVPSYDTLMNPLLEALRNLGGSGTIEEISNEVSKNLNIPDEILEILQNPEKGNRTKFDYRLAWTRTYLKNYGLIENSSRGVWALTTKGRLVDIVDEKEIVQFVKKEFKSSRDEKDTDEPELPNESQELIWQDVLHQILIDLDPSAFERLAQRILRESGFTQVEVTGKSGDGGIDGKGILKVGELISFHVYFQCKRYKGSVGAGTVRDFRGAMSGRADKGLIITTGTFTRAAEEEAIRDGAPPIDLINGEELIALLKKLSLGISTKIISVEEISIDEEWFNSI